VLRAITFAPQRHMNKSGQAFDWSIFRRLYANSGPYRSAFYFTMALVIVIALLSPARPEQMRHILDVSVPNGDHRDLLRMSMWFVAVLSLEALLQYIQTLLANKVAQSITLDLRAKLYRKVLQFKTSWFDRTPVGQLVTRHISDVDGIAEVFSVGMLDIVRDAFKLVVIVGFMLYMNWKMTLVVLLPIPILLWATRIFQLAVKKSFNDVRNEVSRINVFIQEHVSGMSVVQLFNRENREREKFVSINAEHRDAHIRGIWAYSVFFPVVELLSAASISLMLWYGLRASLASEMTAGELLEFSTFIAMLYRPIRQMADNFNVLQMGIINAERVFKILDTCEEQEAPQTSPKIIYGAISFDDVWFAYKDREWVLRGLNRSIQPGETIAIVGTTGAGKSTLVQLLNRTYDIQQGTIRIDGSSILDYSLNALREGIGVVQQEVFLFNDTIHNNITLFDNSVSRETVVHAARAIGADRFIQRLPGGYGFVVNERGSMLSVGQRQLISFVRAYVANPTVLVLDEATANIDSESEQWIQHATAQLTRGRTSIIIAHRISTIRHAHRIWVMENGNITEDGTHEQLLAHNGMYKKLYNRQFSEQQLAIQ
jgi:ATP-binding cassette, subfamily B, multidrug efflux pump